MGYIFSAMENDSIHQIDSWSASILCATVFLFFTMLAFLNLIRDIQNRELNDYAASLPVRSDKTDDAQLAFVLLCCLDRFKIEAFSWRPGSEPTTPLLKEIYSQVILPKNRQAILNHFGADFDTLNPTAKAMVEYLATLQQSNADGQQAEHQP